MIANCSSTQVNGRHVVNVVVTNCRNYGNVVAIFHFRPGELVAIPAVRPVPADGQITSGLGVANARDEAYLRLSQDERRGSISNYLSGISLEAFLRPRTVGALVCPQRRVG